MACGTPVTAMQEAVLPALHMSNIGVRFSGMVLRPDECVTYRSRHINTGARSGRKREGFCRQRAETQTCSERCR